MAGQFLNHPLPVETFFGRVVQDVQPNKSLEQFLMLYPGHRRPHSLAGYQCRRVEPNSGSVRKTLFHIGKSETTGP